MDFDDGETVWIRDISREASGVLGREGRGFLESSQATAERLKQRLQQTQAQKRGVRARPGLPASLEETSGVTFPAVDAGSWAVQVLRSDIRLESRF